MTELSAEMIYQLIKDRPAWLLVAEKVWPDKVDELVEIEKDYSSLFREMEKSWRQKPRKMPEVDLEFNLDAKTRYLASCLADAKSALADERRYQMKKKPESFERISSELREKKIFARIEKLKGKMESIARVRSNPAAKELAKEHLDLARSVEIEKVAIVIKQKTKCIFHDDKHPSAHVYGSRAWCFVCSRGFDAIDILTKRDGYSFVDAVQYLRGL